MHDNDMTVLIKYGGNAMTNAEIRQKILASIARLFQQGIHVVLVHGGGPVIKEVLDKAGIVFRFEEGHRVTDEATMKYVEMALSGIVNKDLVLGLLQENVPAVGISGKDGGMARAVKRWHTSKQNDGSIQQVDLGFVGDIVAMDTHLIQTLLNSGYLPVCSPVSLGRDDGHNYNVNADVFAGALAGALKADAYVVLTDIDGLRKDVHDPSSLIPAITQNELQADRRFIQGGMIPKIDSCCHALQKGAKKAVILNGTKESILEEAFLERKQVGTQILP